MRYTRFAVAALIVAFSAACSNDERETSFVSEAQAAPPATKDSGWRAMPGLPVDETEVKEYY
jgi:hypothetical protein